MTGRDVVRSGVTNRVAVHGRTDAELPRHMVTREGRYWSRLVVPVDLRPYLDGKTELRTPLGGDYRQAVKAHHGRWQSSSIGLLSQSESRPRPGVSPRRDGRATH